MARPRKNLYSIPTPLEVLETREAHLTELVSDILKDVENLISLNWKPGQVVVFTICKSHLEALHRLNPSWWEEILNPYLETRLWHGAIDLETGYVNIVDRESWLALLNSEVTP